MYGLRGAVGDHIFVSRSACVPFRRTWALHHLLIKLGLRCVQDVDGARAGAPTIIRVLEKGDGNLCVLMCRIQKCKSLGSTRRFVR